MRYTALALALALPITACATNQGSPRLPAPQEAFWDALQSHCGKAYRGQLVSEDERDADWKGRAMIAHWAACDERKVAIAFHVQGDTANTMDDLNWDRSRTWIVTREAIIVGMNPAAEYLKLRHDHRHADGTSDTVTMYGGETSPTDWDGSREQDFSIDPDTVVLFRREGLSASLTNVWRVEVDPASDEDARFVYQLTRRNDPSRLFRVEFDASEAVEPPPPAWGW